MQVFIFSSMHVSGEQLDQYTGVAATLRFPLADIDLHLAEAARQKAPAATAAGTSATSGGASNASSAAAAGESYGHNMGNNNNGDSSEDDLLTSSESEDEHDRKDDMQKQVREVRDFMADMGLDFD
jgi:hypothetical protein